MLGKSLISTIFFGDMILEVMYLFHYGEEYDSMVIQISRRNLIDDVHGLFHDPRLVPFTDSKLSGVEGNGEWHFSQLRSQLQVICSDVKDHHGIKTRDAMDWAMRQLAVLLRPQPVNEDLEKAGK